MTDQSIALPGNHHYKAALTGKGASHNTPECLVRVHTLPAVCLNCCYKTTANVNMMNQPAGWVIIFTFRHPGTNMTHLLRTQRAVLHQLLVSHCWHRIQCLASIHMRTVTPTRTTVSPSLL